MLGHLKQLYLGSAMVWPDLKSAPLAALLL